MSAYRPPCASSSACVPRSRMRPDSITRIWCASTTVESRCAMTSAVLLRAALRSSSWIARSLAESSAEVASSKISSGGFFSKVRALADHRVVALRRRRDEVVDVRGSRRALDRRAVGAGAAVGDVVFDGVVEQHRVLRHDADRLARAQLLDVAVFFPVDKVAPAVQVEEEEPPPRQRPLAR